MADIASLDDLAVFLRIDLSLLDIPAAVLALGLAEGLIVKEIGTLDPWPVAVKAVALAAASRVYTNPQGLKRETVGAVTAEYADSGAYLTEVERQLLARLVGAAAVGSPRGYFPTYHTWPDSVEYLTGYAST